MSNPEKEREAKEAMSSFFGQFGTMDLYAKIVLEEFFRGLYGIKEDISVPSETRQEGNKDNIDI